MHSGTRARRSLATVIVRPPRALGVITGGGLAVWAFIFAGLAARVAVGSPTEFKTFLAWLIGGVLLFLGLLFAQWAYGAFTLSYTIDRDTLNIRWGFREVDVPIDTIQRMIPGRTLDEPKIDGLNWWGCHVGSADVKRIGYTLFYSTHSSPDELLYIVTTEESYALTVLDQALFAEEIQARAAMAPVLAHHQRSAATGIAAFPFWRDRVAIVSALVGAIACAVLCGYIYASYPSLPSVIQISFPALNGVVTVGDKSQLLDIAYLGVGIFVANSALGVLVHARDRASGLWLLASGGMLQAVLLAAAILAFERS